MLYRQYGKTNKKISAIGFGSTRFNPADLNDRDGLERCADLVLMASEKGVNFFDIAHNYAKSQCEAIYRIAFKKMKTPFFSSTKSSSYQEKTADEVLWRIDNSLRNLDVDKIHFFYIWSILHEDQYVELMKKGGSYEGAVRAKREGLIEHIVFSSHASPDTTVKIINDDVFEGVTISYNPLNYKAMEKVLQAAEEKGIGVMVMNPLAGGLIPQNEEFFSRYISLEGESVAAATLKFIYSHRAITSILSGFRNGEEIIENTSALREPPQKETDRVKIVENRLSGISGFCTGCGYCRECPRGIKITELMQAYNMSLLGEFKDHYGREDHDLIKRIHVFIKLLLDYQVLLEDSVNPCIRCGRCERVCTQRLPIIERIEKMMHWADISGATLKHYRARLDKLLNGNGYRKVAFYTAGGYTSYVINHFKRFFGPPDFEIIILDSNPSKWGSKLGEYTVYSPDEIPELKPDCILISNFRFSGEIYSGLLKYKEYGIDVFELHEEQDVPWL